MGDSELLEEFVHVLEIPWSSDDNFGSFVPEVLKSQSYSFGVELTTH